jgi:DNA-directed RNA polymerase III subunit RPC4
VTSEGGSGDVSSDEGSDPGPRFSIEQINIVSDSEDGETDIGKGKAPARASTRGSRGLRPVRVERHEHVKKIVGVNTDPSPNKSAELRRLAKEKAGEDGNGLFVQDEDDRTKEEENAEVEVMTTGAVLTTRTGDEGPRVKKEPTEGDVLMADDIPPAVSDASMAKGIGSLKPSAKAREKVSTTDPKCLLPTEEERQEWSRHEQDLAQLKKALGPVNKGLDNAGGGDDLRREAEGKGEAPDDERHGRLFLIQFPPMTPNLVVPQTHQDDLILDTADVGPPSVNPPPRPTSPAIKREGSTNDGATPAPLLGLTSTTTAPSTLMTAANNRLPPGRVGQLQIHQSGRATIDWGGIRFELSKGSDVDFLQDAVVASEQESHGPAESGDSPESRVWAMSQVSGKFVVTPDWDALL